ncbi:MAG: hypothetical protein NXI04_18145 [Planctomycetaceae bacterium]|nr:hypothetical protein [Planctomycetaceae bacterium]
MKYSVLAVMGLLTVTGLNAAPQLTQDDDKASEAVADAVEQASVDVISQVDADAELYVARLLPAASQPQQKKRKEVKVTPRYKVEMQATTANRWAAIRYDANTGKSWRMMDSTWLPIKEVKQLRPKGTSDFLVKIDHTVNERYCALRMDVNSGQCWALKEGTWTPILEEE